MRAAAEQPQGGAAAPSSLVERLRAVHLKMVDADPKLKAFANRAD